MLSLYLSLLGGFVCSYETGYLGRTARIISAWRTGSKGDKPEVRAGEQGKIRVLTVNCHGVRKHRTRLALGRRRTELRVGVRTLAETRRRKRDPKLIDTPGYTEIAGNCRRVRRGASAEGWSSWCVRHSPQQQTKRKRATVSPSNPAQTRCTRRPGV